MELKIYSPQDEGFLQEIKWNFEELKAEISAVAQDYAVSVYTDDTIKNAKADRAKLNKFVDALNAKRTEIRRQLLKPDEQFGREIKELTGIVQGAIENIDGQIKDYERRQREEKTAKIREFYEAHIHDIGEYLPFERVMKPEYANASTTMKSIRQEILDQIQKVDEGLAILNEVDSPYAGDMKKVFLQNYDIGAAMAERNRLEAEQRNREIFLEEVFLWYTPLVQALLISEIAATKAVCAAALSAAVTAASTFLQAVFTLERIALFLAALVSFTKILFLADLMLANLGTSN